MITDRTSSEVPGGRRGFRKWGPGSLHCPHMGEGDGIKGGAACVLSLLPSRCSIHTIIQNFVPLTPGSASPSISSLSPALLSLVTSLPPPVTLHLCRSLILAGVLPPKTEPPLNRKALVTGKRMAAHGGRSSGTLGRSWDGELGGRGPVADTRVVVGILETPGMAAGGRGAGRGISGSL